MKTHYYILFYNADDAPEWANQMMEDLPVEYDVARFDDTRLYRVPADHPIHEKLLDNEELWEWVEPER